jgi:peptidoglycan hydrolase-like protein with peptidoglycan-binding domain
MAQTGIPRIDQVFEGQPAQSIGPGDPDRESVGVIQDFLIGHGFANLPGLLGPGRGLFGPLTTAVVRAFQQNNKLPITGAVDGATLQSLVTVPAAKPIASRGYLTLTLDFAFTGMTRLMSLTTQFEGGGRFGALNANTDGAGLSFGLIQWAQRPGRLDELLRAFQAEQPPLFVQLFGNGDAALAQGLINHTAQPNGGVNKLGQTIDPRFNLVQDPWLSRFRQAALNQALQRVQVNTALAAFGASFQKLQAYAPPIRSERGVAFMLDLANQHGDGGARSIFQKVAQPGLSEAALLLAVQNESVARVRAQFGDGPITQSTLNRRQAFRTSPLLSDNPFNPA